MNRNSKTVHNIVKNKVHHQDWPFFLMLVLPFLYGSSFLHANYTHKSHVGTDSHIDFEY